MIIKKYEDYVSQVQERFPHFTEEEISKILKFGLIRMVNVIKTGCFINIKSQLYGEIDVMIGVLTPNVLKHYKIYRKILHKKIRKLWTWNKEEFDGYYYIGLTSLSYRDFLERNKGKRKYYYFGNVPFKKIYKEVATDNLVEIVYRVKYPWERGFIFINRTPRHPMSDVELYAKRDENKQMVLCKKQ